jgi:hypothetical protein
VKSILAKFIRWSKFCPKLRKMVATAKKYYLGLVLCSGITQFLYSMEGASRGCGRLNEKKG